MINIITGQVNAGKTTKLIEIFNTLGKGDGFINRKIYIDNCYVGQEIVKLSNGKSKVWSYKGATPKKWKQVFSYETYSFSENGLKFAESIISEILNLELEPIYIDEIGPLELQGKGFNKIFNDCVSSGKDLYVVVRECCVNAVIEKYDIENYKIIYPY